MNVDEISSREGKHPTKTKTLSDSKKRKSPDYETRWEDMFQRLLHFKEKHGHCLVPNRYREDRKLGTWVAMQRRQYKVLVSGKTGATPMPPDRVIRLQKVGFEFAAKDPGCASWEAHFLELVQFVAKNGHAKVPSDFKENPKLAKWVSEQREEYKLTKRGHKSRLTPDRCKLLLDTGFVFDEDKQDSQDDFPIGLEDSRKQSVVSPVSGSEASDCHQMQAPTRTDPIALRILLGLNQVEQDESAIGHQNVMESQTSDLSSSASSTLSSSVISFPPSEPLQSLLSQTGATAPEEDIQRILKLLQDRQAVENSLAAPPYQSDEAMDDNGNINLRQILQNLFKKAVAIGRLLHSIEMSNYEGSKRQRIS